MKYRIEYVPSCYWWCGDLAYHTYFKHRFWPFWGTGPMFKTQADAHEWIVTDIANGHKGPVIVEEISS